MKFKEIVKEMCGSELKERIEDYEERIAWAEKDLKESKKRIKTLKQETKNRNETGK